MLVAAGDRVLAPGVVVPGLLHVVGLRAPVMLRLGGMPMSLVPVLLGRGRGIGPPSTAQGGQQHAEDGTHQCETTIANHLQLLSSVEWVASGARARSRSSICPFPSPSAPLTLLLP
jgi:hypothetical protein